MNSHIKKIVVVGGGLTGWSFALDLGKALSPIGVEIVVLELDEITFSECIAVNPSALHHLKYQGIQEADVIKSQQGTYRLATAYKGFTSSNYDYFLPFADHGFMLDRKMFSQYAIWERKYAGAVAYDDYSLSSVAARNERFRHPSDKETSLFSTLTYGYNLNVPPLTEHLKSACAALDVKHVSGSLLKAELTDSLEIAALRVIVDNKAELLLEADFFIDCSGSNALLAGDILNISYHDHTASLPINRVISTVAIGDRSSLPYNSIEPLDCGWLVETQTQNRHQIQFFYYDQFISDEQAALFFCQGLGITKDKTSVRHLYPGRRDAFWHKNCLAVGEAAGYLQGFGVDTLSLLHNATTRFLKLLPGSRSNEILAAEYNRLTHLEFDHVLDFQCVHYRIVTSKNDPYWQYARKNQVSDTLTYRLTTFLNTGRMPFYEGDPILQEIWVSLLLGADLWPHDYDALVDNLDPQWIKTQLNKMRNVISEAAISMPSAKKYIQGLIH